MSFVNAYFYTNLGSKIMLKNNLKMTCTNNTFM